MKREFFLSFIAFLILSFNIFSQNLSTTDSPLLEPDKKELGFFIGFGENIQNGKFKTSCNCLFDNGLKFGFTIGVLYEQQISLQNHISVGSYLGYDNRSIKAIYSEYEPTQVTSSSSGRTESVAILFRNTSEASFHNLLLMPYLKWTPFKYLFFKVGLDLGINISNHLNYTKEIRSTTARLSNGELVSVSFDEKNPTYLIKTIDDGDFPNTNAFIIGVSPMIGGNIFIGKKVTLSPQIYYSIPFTTYSTNGENFNISALRGIIELRIVLNPRSEN